MSSKLREALSDACYAMFNFLKTQNGGYEEMAKALDKAKATLAAPPRNCDVGTAEEQTERFRAYCKPFIACNRMCRNCPLYKGTTNIVECLCKWAQMPYEPVETKTKTNKGE